ncbi:MAG: hypothetical protein KBD21_03585 [Candidatus Pacebacteria bacterium]|nr:hypothetical protein [Candidatus Paceibacterota bacterium]
MYTVILIIIFFLLFAVAIQYALLRSKFGNRHLSFFDILRYDWRTRQYNMVLPASTVIRLLSDRTAGVLNASTQSVEWRTDTLKKAIQQTLSQKQQSTREIVELKNDMVSAFVTAEEHGCIFSESERERIWSFLSDAVPFAGGERTP